MIVSFDVGIKNLSFCVFGDANGTTERDVVAWGVIDLCGEQKSKCTHCMRNGKACGKNASYMVGGSPICGTHVKSGGSKMAPEVYYKVATAKRPATAKLDLLADELGVERSRDKDSLCETCVQTRATKIPKATAASDADLVQLGIAMRDQLPSRMPIASITTVLIENQISTIATRMKTLQGMITQFFIDNSIYDIKFISSSNKLKAYNVPKKTYAERKASGVAVTRQLMDASPKLAEWRESFDSHKKRDDMADAFLQGHWYISTL